MSARGNARCGADCYPAASESGWVVAVMVDTFGIPRVVDARGTSFGRQQIQRTPQPFVRPLTCGGRTCSAAAVAVVGYLRLQTWVEPMFRLGPGAEHSAGCPFNVDQRIDDLVKAHRAAVEPKDCDYDHLVIAAEPATSRLVPVPNPANDQPRGELLPLAGEGGVLDLGDLGVGDPFPDVGVGDRGPGTALGSTPYRRSGQRPGSPRVLREDVGDQASALRTVVMTFRGRRRSHREPRCPNVSQS